MPRASLMVRLAFDTSSDTLSVALAADGGVLAHHESVGHRHAELILPTVNGLLAEAGKRLADVQAIAFGVGPGAFTGLRIACGVAQGLGLALGVPLVPIDAFRAIAQEVRDEDPSALRVLVAIDARMRELYVSGLVADEGGWRVERAPALVEPRQLAEVAGAAAWIGAGSGFAAYGESIGFSGRVHPASAPRAAVMLRLIDAAIAAGGVVDPADAAPLYLRDQVALTIAERAAARAGATR